MTTIVTVGAQAGISPIIEKVIVDDLGGGLTEVSGSLVGVRFTDDDVQQIGCRVRGSKGAPPSVACVGVDIN